jgi:hypothetical protein
MITTDDYFTGPDGKRRDVLYASEMNAQIAGNAHVTVDRWNLLLTIFYQENPTAKRRWVHSGWRSKAINDDTPGHAEHSTHLTGEALDASDEDRMLARWIVGNELAAKKLAVPSHADKIGLWFEDFRTTPTWVHGQIVPPHSGNRIYIPSNDWAARLGGRVLTLDQLQVPIAIADLQ